MYTIIVLYPSIRSVCYSVVQGFVIFHIFYQPPNMLKNISQFFFHPRYCSPWIFRYLWTEFSLFQIELDKRFGCMWHVVVGEDFGFQITNEVFCISSCRSWRRWVMRGVLFETLNPPPSPQNKISSSIIFQ